MTLRDTDILAFAAAYRRNFMNTLPGLRGLHLLGTKGHRGTPNLGVFNSVVHLGATPPLLGFVLRPLTVPRHTYHNILAQGYFTLNTVHPDFLAQAHQSSANYALSESEFSAVGLTPTYTDTHPAPYVAESAIKIGLALEEEHSIAANGTRFIVGRVVEIMVPDQAVQEDGHVDHTVLDTVACSGLETYFRGEQLARFDYARVPKADK